MSLHLRASRLSIVFCFLLSVLHAADTTVKFPDVSDAVLTSKLTHFPYRHYAAVAMKRRDEGLHELFRFTVTESFVGAGADDHCSMLRALLFHWGDREFARVLAEEPANTRQHVISALDDAWPNPGWQEKQFPETYRLGIHYKVRTMPYDRTKQQVRVLRRAVSQFSLEQLAPGSFS